MWWEVVHANARSTAAPGEGTGGEWGPGVRWGHTCNAVDGGRFIYVFGGYGGDKRQTNDVHVFDAVKQIWSKPMFKGVPPTPRDSHSCTTVGDKLFVFGGTDGKQPLKDLYILDTSSKTWMMPDLTSNGPDAREGHTAVLAGKQLFIFGGCGKSENDEEKYFNDLYILDTENLTWECALTSGTPPSARHSHSCSLWKNKIVVIGGEDSSDCYLSDVHVLDAETLVWEWMKTSGQILLPRAGHTTVTLGSSLFVFGGFTDSTKLYDDLHVLNMDPGIWSRITPLNRGPSARFSVAGDCLSESKGIIVFIGGCNESLRALDDMYYLHADIPMVDGLYNQRDKISIKRELRKMCKEEFLLNKGSANHNDLFKHGKSSEIFQSETPQENNLAGMEQSNRLPDKEMKFKGRITNANRYGYAIETIINGELLQGMLFSCTSSFTKNNDAYRNKRMAAAPGSPEGNINIPDFMAAKPPMTTNSSGHGLNAGAATVQMPSVDTCTSNVTNLTPDSKEYGANM